MKKIKLRNDPHQGGRVTLAAIDPMGSVQPVGAAILIAKDHAPVGARQPSPSAFCNAT
ncbi:hypothetical protein JAGODDHD_03177 [Sphingomonas paucimobilis]|jgi:hypothetical protein|nr:hypothetical protein [Sphingomonas paucimobilis]SUJ21833.1 Uncharacterised protein [Sphingomonas paucimobilis]